MGYVMVPVPEEHVEEAMQMVLRIATRAKLQAWDQERVTALFHGVDEPTRSVMSAVARGTLAESAVADTKVADAIEFTQREVLGIVRELNDRASQDEMLGLFAIRQDVETLPNGRTRERRMLSMESEVAGFVREAERAEAASAPHPLLSDQG